MKRIIGLSLSIALVMMIASFQQEPKPWDVPEKYQKMKNPVKSDSVSVKVGKEMYNRYCKSCHGIKGKGDGPKALKLNQSVGDFTSESFKKETDGAIFYKMTVGHLDMPSFKKKVPSNDDVIEGSFGKTGSVGDLINYIRTLADK